LKARFIHRSVILLTEANCKEMPMELPAFILIYKPVSDEESRGTDAIL